VDIKALKDRHGENFGEQLLKSELGISPQSFLQSLWLLVEKKQYQDVLETYELLAQDHPYKSQDVHVVALLASSGSFLPKKVCASLLLPGSFLYHSLMNALG
jgi:hypothetical protein